MAVPHAAKKATDDPTSENSRKIQLETDKARAGSLPTVDAVASVGAADQRGSAFALPGTTPSAKIGRAHV